MENDGTLAKVDKEEESWLDYCLDKVISRKLMAWVVGTCLFIYGLLPDELWFQLTLGYIGAQTFVDSIVAWKRG